MITGALHFYFNNKKTATANHSFSHLLKCPVHHLPSLALLCARQTLATSHSQTWCFRMITREKFHGKTGGTRNTPTPKHMGALYPNFQCTWHPASILWFCALVGAVCSQNLPLTTLLMSFLVLNNYFFFAYSCLSLLPSIKIGKWLWLHSLK